MDNLSTHTVAGVGQAIAAVGARVVYLPLYSSDMNPIELGSQSSSGWFAAPLNVRSTASGVCVEYCSINSRPANAKTISATAAIPLQRSLNRSSVVNVHLYSKATVVLAKGAGGNGTWNRQSPPGTQ